MSTLNASSGRRLSKQVMRSGTGRRAPLCTAIAILAFVLSGCDAFRGAPKPYMESDTAITDNREYLAGDAVRRFNSPDPAARDGMNQRQWRDTVINSHIQIIDLRYVEFKQALNRDTAIINLGTDLTALALSGAGAVATGGAANVLSAAAAGVIGANLAFNKDVYYQKTLPALFKTMDADRKQVLVRIRTAQKDGDEVSYPLGAAMADVRDYEAAGSIESAIAGLTTLATNASDAADAQLKALFVVTVVDDTTQGRKVALANYVRGLAKKEDNKTTLDNMAKALQLAPVADIMDERNNILLEIDRTVVGKQSMDDICNKLGSTVKDEKECKP